MKVAFRADGGPSIGLGHIVRCKALAEEFKSRGENVVFITKYKQFLDKILYGEFKIISLTESGEAKNTTNSWNYGSEEELEQELAELQEIIKDFEIDVLIIDSYIVTDNYFFKLKNFVPFLCYIDDLNKFKFSVDMIINGNIYGQDLNYSSHYPHTKFLLGPEYAMLRAEFQSEEHIEIRSKVTNILITIGGSDPFNLTGRLLEAVSLEPALAIYDYSIIIGEGFKFKSDLLLMERDNIHFLQNVQNMREIMLSCDIAISGGGSTLYELSRCGVPTLAFILADNQVKVVEKMYQLGSIEKLGWYDKVDDETIKAKIRSMIQNEDLRLKLHTSALKIIDGTGVKRIADSIEKAYSQN